LEVKAELSSEGERLENLARTINPQIEFKRGASIGIAIGTQSPAFETTYFAGSDGWDGLLSIAQPLGTRSSANPFGAGAAACLAVSNVFNHVLSLNEGQSAMPDVCLSTFLCEKGQSPRTVPNDNWNLTNDVVLVGAGAVGNAAVWSLGQSLAIGRIHLVDYETLELSNLQRYVLAARTDDGRPKVEIAASFFGGSMKCVPHRMRWADFVEKNGYDWQQVQSP
jgi:hypothetical protein